MMQQQAFDLFGVAPRVVTGRQLKRRGQSAALRRAGLAWQVKVMKALRGWLVMKDQQGELRTRFVFEDFRSYAAAFQALRPGSANAWGSLPKMAVAAGLIESTGQMVRSQRPDAHGRLVHLWAVRPQKRRAEPLMTAGGV